MTYHIPANYTDAGRLFGLFPIRNTVEAAILAIPTLFLCFRLLPFTLTTNIVITMALVVPTAGFALVGLYAGHLRQLQILQCRDAPHGDERRGKDLSLAAYRLPAPAAGR